MRSFNIPTLLLAALAFVFGCQVHADERPNILWITSEDNGQFLGCYGDKNAKTPNLDKLAAQGIRYTNSFANAPVCAVARSSWIWGVPAVTTGTLHMRSKYSVPRDTFTTYPELLREAGYYVTNCSKTDYNTRTIVNDEIWDECSKNAHYKNRPDGKPFFAIFNVGQSHESGIFPNNKGEKPRVAPEKIQVPPYQVATPEVINDWQRYYDRLELMDDEVGKVLKELEELGEAENTIVAYCSDHGGVTLRSKRFLHDSGTRIPLLVYFPGKWRHLAPEDPGTVSDRLVQFIDMPKTWLSLAGFAPPEVMPGKIFLGDKIQPAPETVFLFSGRFDEAPDNSRAVTDGRWKYIRNFESDRSRFQMLTYPLRQDGQVSQYEAFAAGKTNPAQSAQYRPQPSEELYDTENDPHEVNNLAESNPEVLAAMREKLDQHILANRDLGFIPEPMMEAINNSGGETIFEFGQSEDNYPIEKILNLAKAAAEKDADNIGIFRAALDDRNPVIRYWGTVGLRALGEEAAPGKSAIEKAMQDPSASVRITAAVSLGRLGDKDRAVDLLIKEAKEAQGDIHAMWALDGLKQLDMPEAIEGIPQQELAKGAYSKRIVQVLNAGGSAWRMPNERL